MPHNSLFECGTCGKGFPAGWRARENHCRATGHSAPEFECDSCYRRFQSRAACNQHMVDTNHGPYVCSCCSETWLTEVARSQHEVAEHLYCGECQRYFQSLNNIKMHLNSRHHRRREIECPFCNNPYTTATGLTHHLETGACSGAQDLDRDRIYRFVRSKDPDGLISKKLIGWTGSYEYEVNELSWNGDAYECYLCHRSFNRLLSLNQHLDSPTHQQALYHCPHRQCRTEFKTLAAIINHLESESCGFIRFEQVQQKFGNFIGSNRQIAF